MRRSNRRYYTLPKLPGKSVFKRINEQFLSERRGDLETYLAALTAVRGLRGSPTILQFLSRSDPASRDAQLISAPANLCAP